MNRALFPYQAHQTQGGGNGSFSLQIHSPNPNASILNWARQGWLGFFDLFKTILGFLKVYKGFYVFFFFWGGGLLQGKNITGPFYLS